MASPTPIYWRLGPDGWELRRFDRWGQIQSRAAVIHVNLCEAKACCHCAGRRLPSELAWELAAAEADPTGPAAPWQQPLRAERLG
jgi:iron(II)-dependent oxidoreductase